MVDNFGLLVDDCEQVLKLCGGYYFSAISARNLFTRIVYQARCQGKKYWM